MGTDIEDGGLVPATLLIALGQAHGVVVGGKLLGTAAKDGGPNVDTPHAANRGCTMLLLEASCWVLSLRTPG